MTLTDYYNKNIDTLNQLCDKYNWAQDYIGDTYPKIKENLQGLTGLTEEDYYRYIYRAIYNRMIDDTRSKERKFVHVQYNENPATDEEKQLQHSIELKLCEIDEWDSNGKLYMWELEYLSRLLFKYIEHSTDYTEVEVFIFKTYAITGLTYKEIESRFKLSKDKAKNVMRKFRKDLKYNFINYVKEHDYELH